jgi:hypothetical protein
LSRRIAIQYPLDDLPAGQAKAILQMALPGLTEAEIVQIVRLAGGVHGHLELMIARILELRKSNAKDLATGEVTMPAIIHTAASKLMIA